MEEEKKSIKRRASEDLDDLVPAQPKRTRTEDDILEFSVGGKVAPLHFWCTVLCTLFLRVAEA